MSDAWERNVIATGQRAALELAALASAATNAGKTHVVVPVHAIENVLAAFAIVHPTPSDAPRATDDADGRSHAGKSRKRRSVVSDAI